jgi:hypothetical protein
VWVVCVGGVCVGGGVVHVCVWGGGGARWTTSPQPTRMSVAELEPP